MSDLQVALLAIGIAVIAAVVAYNKWQEIRLGRKSERDFAGRHSDVLLEDSAPATRSAAPDFEHAARDATERVEHTLGDSESTAAAEPEASDPGRVRRTQAALDSTVDYIVTLDCPRPIEGSALAQHARKMVGAGFLKPVHWEGYDDADAVWRPVTSDGRRFMRARVGLQLTNRAGPVTEEELNAFRGSLEEVAVALGARAGFPDIAEATARAQALDRFCAEVDMQIGLSVISDSAQTFSGSEIQATAEGAGFAIGRDGRFHCRAEDGAELYTLANLEPMPFHAETIKSLKTNGVTVLFDVPRVPASPTAFRRYMEFARELERTLGGALVDDDRKAIGQAALDAIAQRLGEIHRAMAAKRIQAGGPLALRLFS
jgi:FtsZ-interacting cell division protein ZipA